MRVVISVGGVFHAFKLAEQLEQRGVFHELYTTYPKFKWHDADVPESKVTAIRYPEAIYHAAKLPGVRRVIPKAWRHQLDRVKCLTFDRSVRRKLTPVTDGIFVGFAGKSHRSLKRAAELGYTTVVERSSVHIRTQNEILTEEAERFGLEQPPIAQERIDRETREYELADYIVTPSEFATQSFLDRGFDERKLRTVPIGETPDRNGLNDPAADRPDDDGRVRFVFCGSVGFQKGVPYLLEAWDELGGLDAELVLLGGIEADIREHIAPYRERDDVRFVGWTDDVYSWYDSSDVFVLPSIQDGWGMVVNEAMGSGLPAIVSEHVGAKDCIRERQDGFVVPVRNSEALADAMRYLHDNPDERRRMGRSAMAHTRANYTLEKYGDHVVEAYRSML